MADILGFYSCFAVGLEKGISRMLKSLGSIIKQFLGLG